MHAATAAWAQLTDAGTDARHRRQAPGRIGTGDRRREVNLSIRTVRIRIHAQEGPGLSGRIGKDSAPAHQVVEQRHRQTPTAYVVVVGLALASGEVEIAVGVILEMLTHAG